MIDLNLTKEKENHWSDLIMKTSSVLVASHHGIYVSSWSYFVLLLRCIYSTLLCFSLLCLCLYWFSSPQNVRSESQ